MRPTGDIGRCGHPLFFLEVSPGRDTKICNKGDCPLYHVHQSVSTVLSTHKPFTYATLAGPVVLSVPLKKPVSVKRQLPAAAKPLEPISNFIRTPRSRRRNHFSNPSHLDLRNLLKELEG